MKRIMLSTIGTAALALALPGAALASHSHERVHHHHKAHSFSNPVSVQNAGTVSSYTAGVLTLTLSNGSTVSGTVTSATEIECEMTPPTPVANAADHGDRGNHDQNDNDNDQNDDRDEAPVCDTSVLVPGAVVHEAELRIDSAGSRFTSVEISR